MKYFFIVIILTQCNYVLFSQGYIESLKRPKNNISIGILGDISHYSLSYERYFVKGPKYILIAKAGVGYNKDFIFCIFSQNCIAYDYLTFPIHISANFGSKEFFFEVGLGSTYATSVRTENLFIYPFAGIRLVPLKSNRFNFRIFGLLPILLGDDHDILALPVGLNVGFSF